MRRPYIAYLICLAFLAPAGVWTNDAAALQRRQGPTNTALPTLTSIQGASSATAATSAPIPTLTPTPSDSSSSQQTEESSSDAQSSTSHSSNSTTAHTSSTSTSVSTGSSPTASSHNSTATAQDKAENVLPLQPHITPALSIAGVILILTGVTYALIGVKNRWVQIFLSTGYLTSLSIAVLIDYVMSPPVSNAIQGAYFVGILMTGVMFGAGALIFKEVTEGLGCLLGGFSISMWFLTLKSGGLITSATGKGIFVAIFCVLAWSLSFSHYTRAYALIGSTSFSGATAFVLGVDCFSRAGLKEFWFYLWALNDNLFPLNTNTYPITRGIRVETVIILLGTFIGVMSQIKLWRVVRDKQRKKDATRLEDERRKDVVEEALGRHLERQNDRDRAHWEKQYGDRLQSKRSTILWSDAHPEKRHTNISIAEAKPTSQSSGSSESLEMTAFGPRRPASTSNPRNKRTSTATVDVIHEEQEDPETRVSTEREKALKALEDPNSIKDRETITATASESAPSATQSPVVVPLPFKVPNKESGSQSDKEQSTPSKDLEPLDQQQKGSKRRSLQSLLSRSPRLSTDKVSSSESQEALVLPELHHSRASSVAATLDEENEQLDTASLERVSSNEPRTPQIIISPAGSYENLKDKSAQLHEPSYNIRDEAPSPPALSINFDFDPEELTRPLPEASNAPDNTAQQSSPTTSVPSKAQNIQAAPIEAVKHASEGYTQSEISTGQSSMADGLTKGALEQVPSQLSNVVLSYRTNEWAKHISTADAPVFDEPLSLEEAEDDAPVQLAPVTPASPPPHEGRSIDSPKTLAAASKPPPPHVIAAATDGTVTANVRPLQRSFSDETAAPAQPSMPVRSASTTSTKPLFPKNKRSSLTPMQAKQSLANTPIDENEPTEFLPARSSKRRSIGSTVTLPTRVQSPPPALAQNGVSAMQWANSRVSLVDQRPMISRSSSALDSYPAMDNHPAMRSDPNLLDYGALGRSTSSLSNRPAMRSETRLDSYESRQPQRRQSNNDNQRRESLLAEWRMSQQQGAMVNHMPKANVETRRAQMLLDKEHSRLAEDQQRAAQQQKQFAIDQVMRRPDMQDLHREAMRKMQASANKNI